MFKEMKKICYLPILTSLAITSIANESFESSFYRQQTIDQINWGGLTISNGGKDGLATLTIFDTGLSVGTGIQIPLTISTSAYLNGVAKDQKDLAHSIINPDTGIFNLKINLVGGDIRPIDNDSKKQTGVCYFLKREDGVCDLSIDFGLKSIEYKNLSNKKTLATSTYLSTVLQLDIPFANKKSSDKRLSISTSFTAQNFDVSSVLSAHENDSSVKFSGWLKTVELGINYSINKNFAVQFSGPLSSSQDELNREVELSLIYRP